MALLSPPWQVIGVICLLVWLINYQQFLTIEMDGWVPKSFAFNFAKCTYYFKIAVALAVACRRLQPGPAAPRTPWPVFEDFAHQQPALHPRASQAAK